MPPAAGDVHRDRRRSLQAIDGHLGTADPHASSELYDEVAGVHAEWTRVEVAAYCTGQRGACTRAGACRHTRLMYTKIVGRSSVIVTPLLFGVDPI